MSVATTDYLAAIEHLPAGAVLCIDDVPWEEYENLLADLGESYAVRIFYDRGRMEIMAPGSTHERPKSAINRLITVLSDELDIDLESLGSTTLKAQIKAKEGELAAVNNKRRDRVAQVDADARRVREEYDHRSSTKREKSDSKREELAR